MYLTEKMDIYAMLVWIYISTGLAGAQHFRSLGCWKDSENHKYRAFEHGPYKPTRMTVTHCVRFCAAQGFAFVGIQDGSECWCGNDEKRWRQFGQEEDRHCNKFCAEGSGTRLPCGGGWRNSVYSTPVLYSTTCKPKDCVYGSWGSWGVCQGPCGYLKGTRSRLREIVREAECGGMTCIVITDKGPCTRADCLEPTAGGMNEETSMIFLILIAVASSLGAIAACIVVFLLIHNCRKRRKPLPPKRRRKPATALVPIYVTQPEPKYTTLPPVQAPSSTSSDEAYSNPALFYDETVPSIPRSPHSLPRAAPSVPDVLRDYRR